MNQANGSGDKRIGEVIDRIIARAEPEREEQLAKRQKREEEREAMQRVGLLAGRLGKRYSPKLCSLATFEVECEKQKVAFDKLKAVKEGLREFVEAGRNLVFLGTVGTGKDHLMAAMLYAAAQERYRCGWFNGQEVFGSFRDRIDTGDRDEDYFRELCDPDVIGISDPIPPVGSPSAWDTANLYRIVDRRYRAVKPTWVSLNAANEEEADRRLSEPVSDRIMHGAEIIRCFWPSFRQKGAS